LSSPAHADRQDCAVLDVGRVVGRIYELWPSTPADIRWFQSITPLLHRESGW
jgi:hypothetical protein